MNYETIAARCLWGLLFAAYAWAVSGLLVQLFRNRRPRPRLFAMFSALALLALGLAGLAGCATKPPIPPIPAFFEKVSPADGATGVVQPVLLSWDYVGDGVIPAPTAFDVLTNGVPAGAVLGLQLSIPQMPDGATLTWQLVAHTQAGLITGGVQRFTVALPPAPVPPAPTPSPAPTPGPVAGDEWRGCLFHPYDSPTPPWISWKCGVDGTHAYATHGQTWENDMRLSHDRWTQAWGGNAIAYITESLAGNAELQMFITGRRSPVDDHQMNATDNSVLTAEHYGVTKWMPILFDSPDSKFKRLLAWLRMSPARIFRGPPTPIKAENRNAYIDEMVSCRNSRPWSAFGWLPKERLAISLGLECNRDWDAATTVSIAQYTRSVATPGVRIVVGSQNVAFLLDVGQRMAGLDAWLEAQAGGGNPITVPLTRATFAQFLADLQKLAGVFGVDHVWPGEWWMADPADMEWAVAQLRAAGFTHFGCGKFAAKQVGAGPQELHGFVERMEKVWEPTHPDYGPLAPVGCCLSPVSAILNMGK